MTATQPLHPIPSTLRTETNAQLSDSDLAALDDNARFIVRRMVANAYAYGYEQGWFAGQDDARTDRAIRFDAELNKEKKA